jgi:hypothetical protein
MTPLGSPISFQKRGARFGTNVPMITELGQFVNRLEDGL